jgi:signal transduction histidine kinase/CheY-like chemotaxis protein
LNTQEQLDLQRMQIFISQHTYIIASYLFIPFFISMSFWLVDSFVPPEIWWWCGGAFLFFLNRIRYHVVLLRTQKNAPEFKKRRFELAIYYTCIIPFFWSYPMVFADVESLPLTLSLLASSVVLITGVVSNTLTLPRLYIGFSLVFTVVLLVRLLYLDFPLFDYYAFMFTAVLCGSFLMGAVHYKMTTDSIMLRFENAELLKQVTAQKEIAENANLSKSRFLVAASHDLSQPLNALSLSVDILEKQREPKKALNVVTHMKAAISGLRNLFADISDISRLDADAVSVEITPVNLQEMVDNLLVEFSSLATAKNLSLRSYISDDRVWSDARQLERIIRNLLSNAIKYTDEGGVLIGTRRSGNNLRLEVWDSGKGIPASEVNNIYQEFYQINNLERDRSKGIGLGLSIVERLSTLLGHPLKMKSVFGKGSVFCITLAKVDVYETSKPNQVSDTNTERAEQTHTVDLTGQKILVVDDEISICQLMDTLLTGWGAKVKLAGCVADVNSHLDDFVPTLLITDYWLRNKETANEVINTVYDRVGIVIPTLVVTGTTSKKEFQTELLENLIVIQKPINATELQTALIELCKTQ